MKRPDPKLDEGEEESYDAAKFRTAPPMVSVEDLDIDEEENLSHLTSRTLLLKRPVSS